ncbi:hypothetical protein L916_19343, partial [Phytophthora nicotianae]
TAFLLKDQVVPRRLRLPRHRRRRRLLVPSRILRPAITLTPHPAITPTPHPVVTRTLHPAEIPTRLPAVTLTVRRVRTPVLHPVVNRRTRGLVTLQHQPRSRHPRSLARRRRLLGQSPRLAGTRGTRLPPLRAILRRQPRPRRSASATRCFISLSV